MKIKYSKIALDELRDIKAWIARDSKYYADGFIKKITHSIRRLIDFPFMGRILPEIKREDIREIIYKHYRIIYKVKNDAITILTVIHGSRLLDESGPWLME